MRAREFIIEQDVGKISKRQRFATRGLHKFRDEDYADRTYELNRIMMAVASTDGTFVPDLDGESWSGRHNTAHPYTKEENDMLKQAYKAVGSKHWDLNDGDMTSDEVPIVNKQSPIKAFKGYPR